MNYELMSDFEINKLVARLLDDIDVDDSHTAVDCYLSNSKTECVKWYKVHYDDPSEYDLFHPCNNLADAWPIMLENGIAPLAENGRIYGATTDTYEYYEPRGNVVYSCEDENPLRAAMIVFLMMSES